MAGLKAILMAAALALPSSAWAEALLLMAEEPGCMWCARWNEDNADVYPKTAEGRAAPLVRYDLRAGAPKGIELARAVAFTPTFILVSEGREVSRIEGYPGEDFFWGLLGQMLRDAEIETPTTETQS